MAQQACYLKSLCQQGSIELRKLEFQTNETKIRTVNNRVLKNIYINQRLAYGNTPSNVEFEVSNNVEDQGYEFIQESNFLIPMSLLQNHRAPKLFGERFIEDFDVKYRMIRKNGRYFFNHPFQDNQGKQMKSKFLCASQPGFNVKCSVIETKMVFEIPYTAVVRNRYRNCICHGKGLLKRYDNHSHRLKILRQ